MSTLNDNLEKMEKELDDRLSKLTKSLSDNLQKARNVRPGSGFKDASDESTCAAACECLYTCDRSPVGHFGPHHCPQ